MKRIEVVAAVIEYEGEILCVKRGESKLKYVSEKWEFPGGKIEVGETHKTALSREILEELELQIEVNELIMSVEHQYPDFHLTMHSYLCTPLSKNSDGSVKMKLTEHLDLKWLKAYSREFNSLDWAAADIPIVKNLKTLQEV